MDIILSNANSLLRSFKDVRANHGKLNLQGNNGNGLPQESWKQLRESFYKLNTNAMEWEMNVGG